MNRFETIVLNVRKNALDLSTKLQKEEEILINLAEVNKTTITGELQEAFI